MKVKDKRRKEIIKMKVTRENNDSGVKESQVKSDFLFVLLLLRGEEKTGHKHGHVSPSISVTHPRERVEVFVSPLRGADSVERTLTPPVSLTVGRGAPRGDHGGPDEEGRQQPRTHHLRRLRQRWQTQGVKPTARGAGRQVGSPLLLLVKIMEVYKYRHLHG